MYVRAAGALREELGGHTRGANSGYNGIMLLQGNESIGNREVRHKD
jgi:hypothetical protein